MNTTTKPGFSEMSGTLQIMPLNQLPLLKKGDDLAGIIVSRARKLGVGIRNRDLVVIGQKAVSEAEGREWHRKIGVAESIGAFVPLAARP